MRDVVREIADNQSLFELQSVFGRSMVTGLARSGGVPRILMANQPAVQAGAITRDCTEKAAQFVKAADHFSQPLISLLDNPGAMPGP